MTSVHARLLLDELAAGKQRLTGELTSNSLDPRLASALAVESPEGLVTYELNFNRDRRRGIYITGKIRARLRARCQRCLALFDVNFQLPVHLLIPDKDSQPSEQTEWDITESGVRPTLAELIADELLLAMPSVPRHPEGTCSLPGVRG